MLAPPSGDALSPVPNVPLVLTVPRYTNDYWHHPKATLSRMSQMYRWCLQYHVTPMTAGTTIQATLSRLSQMYR
jgi:hypothetical protein